MTTTGKSNPEGFWPRTAEVVKVEYADEGFIKIRTGFVIGQDARMLYIAQGADDHEGNWETVGHIDIDKKDILNLQSSI